MNRVSNIMNKFILSILLLLLAGTTSIALAQTCRSTSEIPSSTPSSRFTENGDGTVSDTFTGLMWAKYHETQTNGPYTVHWDTALARAEASTLAGHTDWRLPNIKELLTIVEVRCEDPVLNSQVFPATGTVGTYWSATPDVNFSSAVWALDFGTGRTTNPDRDRFHYVRLVRDAQ